MEILLPQNQQFDIYFTIAKFVNNMGYSLTQNQENGAVDQTHDHKTLDPIKEQQRQEEILKTGAIPEFVQVSNVFQIYKAFTEANIKNKMLSQRMSSEDLLNNS